MVGNSGRVTVGFPRIMLEPEEVRDVLPDLVAVVTEAGGEARIESGLGGALGFDEQDYVDAGAEVVTRSQAMASDIVVVLRPPELHELRRGSSLVSMLHFPTHKDRALALVGQGVGAVALDLITDEEGKRLVENMQAVAWNGLHTAFRELARTYERFFDKDRAPIHVTVLGTGRVGRYAVEAATKFGDPERNERYIEKGLPGVRVTAVGRNLTSDVDFLRRTMRDTDILVDATSRRDPSVAVVPNELLGELPYHAIVCDLSVDPYLLDERPQVVRGIEGIPSGDLGKFVFRPDEPVWDAKVPDVIPSAERRTVVSCYSWPGIFPVPCMERYGRQLAPLLAELVHVGGVEALDPKGGALERALFRGSLQAWVPFESDAA